jgi:hypothetical protein
MNKTTLGFITGCLNKQKSILPENLYHQQILNFLRDKNPSSDFEIALGSYVSYSQFQKTTLDFIKNKEPELLFIFLRPFPLMPLNKPLIKYRKNDKKIAWAIHPSFFKRDNFLWDEKFTRHEKEIEFNVKRRIKFELRDLNLLFGLLFGLNRWCVKFLVNEIKMIVENNVHQDGKHFFILLPQNPESLMGNYICKLTNKKIRTSLSDTIDFIDISRISKLFFEKDGIHFNSKGHEYLARILFRVINKEIN